MEEDQEWSDSSYVLRRRYRLNWSAIIRNVPEGLEGLYETFSRWSVSLGFSLPNLVEESDELCIQKGEKKIYIVSFPSRSSTKSFIRLSRRNIWREISKDSYSELYVYCDPAYKLRPFNDFETMNLSTCYWLIRGIPKDIENDEVIWDFVGRRNPYGEFLRRLVYIRDEEGVSGFCFLQFSSPLTSYRALKWEIKHSKEFGPNFNRKNLIPEFVGTSHVKALLTLCKGLDKFETKTLKSLESSIKNFIDSEQLNNVNISRGKVLQGYLSFWKRSKCVSVPVDRNSEFQYCGDENYESLYREALYTSGIDKFPRGRGRLYYCNSLNFLWDWDTRVFLDCQSKSLFEFDPELQSLKFIYNSGKSSQFDNTGHTFGEDYSDRNIQEDCHFKTQISKEKLRKEKEIRVASFLETARSQLNYNMNNYINSNSVEDRNSILDSEYDSKRQKITQFFDTSSHITHEKSQTGQRPNFCNLIYNNSDDGAKNPCTNNVCKTPGQQAPECGEVAPSVCMWSVSDVGVTEETMGEEINRIDAGSKNGIVSEEELICFVCCRVFGSVWERVNHEQKSSLHKYNLEIWRDKDEF
ncbi:uncharacterized protein cubi_02713 [Cryptosporidium ubiquitum]|uniref:Uncharacterized protein n=1 Tax=Cryptosporidium ubiquitum TaxID=857276 RepID=A0A1J4MIS4_9CRYT|nr:uncharacterized protein cubi_02713 [Cryptosporidium ubiquitum]OII73911.1 hypothetical protein cubi_02713 [Cryptosporidium ubiquitum]